MTWGWIVDEEYGLRGFAEGEVLGNLKRESGIFVVRVEETTEVLGETAAV